MSPCCDRLLCHLLRRRRRRPSLQHLLLCLFISLSQCALPGAAVPGKKTVAPVKKAATAPAKKVGAPATKKVTVPATKKVTTLAGKKVTAPASKKVTAPASKKVTAPVAKKVPAKTVPAKKVPVKKMPVKKLPVKKLPVKKLPVPAKRPVVTPKKVGSVKAKKPAATPKPASPDNSVVTGSPTPQQIDTAVKRLNFFIGFLQRKGSYNKFADLFVSTGLNATLVNLLPFFGCTILVPDDQAFKKISGPDSALANAKRDGMLQLLAFHVWFPAMISADLRRAPIGSQYSTADYPVKGIAAFKVDAPGAVFNGRRSDTWGANLIHDTMYFDQTPTLLVAHGVDRVMVPIKFF